MNTPIAAVIRLGTSSEGLSAFAVMAAAIVLLLPLMVLAGYGLRKAWGTTLAAPIVWTMLSCVLLGWVAYSSFATEEVGSSSLRFLAFASTFCPVMAVLGAKRPQHLAWQWVVLSLWLVLGWPAAQAILAGGGLELFIAWKLFIVGLITVGLLNYLPTRHWLATLLVSAGQVALFAEFLWADSDSSSMLLLGSACFLSAGLVVLWSSLKAEVITDNPLAQLDEFGEKWLHFRNAYGAFWALRILGRVNETAGLRKWPLHLEWQGYRCEEEGEPTPEQMRELEQCWETLMRRFW